MNMADRLNGFTICLLLYGDFPALARRSLGSLAAKLDPDLVYSIRIGLNAVCDETRQYVQSAVQQFPSSVATAVLDNGPENIPKYKVMRRMFYDLPLLTQFVTWFDDDSCLSPAATSAFWGNLHRKLQMADVVGALYKIRLRPGQADSIRKQPWYRGVSVYTGQPIIFPTGGWWAARTSVVYDADYPFPDLNHNGGDVMLGAMCAQQQLRLQNYREGLWINADMNGRESKAARRGLSEQPVWSEG